VRTAALVLCTLLTTLPPAAACSTKSGPGPDKGEASTRAADALDASGNLDASGSEADASAEGGLVDVDGGAGSSAREPFGPARLAPRVLCSGVAGRVADKDLRTSFVDGNDLLALMNRSPTGQLAPDWAPTDLVDLQSGQARTAAECERTLCLRKEAASALGELLAEMKKRGFPGKVESAFRSYAVQCGTFLRWASKGTFCDATEQSALPGHSQHQLGTTVDLFTEEWASDPHGVFRAGFGCTPAGKFLQEHATELGFVMPYPLHPDDRHPRQRCTARFDIPVPINPKTGYRFEHWHARYVGKAAAARFAAALAASGPGKPTEITVEQWLRSEKGIKGGDAELPVCDGCNCGACSTLAAPGESACDRKGGALHLDEAGRPLAATGQVELTGARVIASRKWKGRLVEVKLNVPEGTLTQPPIVNPDGAGYPAGSTFQSLAPYPSTPERGFPPLERAWVVGVEPVPNDTGVAFPWRAGIALTAVGQTYDRADVLLPARAGTVTLKVPVPGGSASGTLRAALLEGGVVRGEPRTVEGERER